MLTLFFPRKEPSYATCISHLHMLNIPRWFDALRSFSLSHQTTQQNMLQTSISTWLRKPQSTKDPPPPPPTPLASYSTMTAKPAPSPQPRHPQHTPPAPSAAPPPPATTQLTSIPSKPPPALPPNITLEPLTAARLPSFRRLNALLLQIPYPPKFYDEILSDPITASVTLVAIWHDTPPSSSSSSPSSSNDSSSSSSSAAPPPPPPPQGRLIAGIRCRLQPAARPDTLYVSTLCTLSPYRQHGAASALLAAVTRRAAREHGVRSVRAHVWEASADARRWYAARGFVEEAREDGYYRRLRPAGAVVVRRAVGVGNAVGWGG